MGMGMNTSYMSMDISMGYRGGSRILQGGGGLWQLGGGLMYVKPSMVRRLTTALSENFKFWSQLGGGGLSPPPTGSATGPLHEYGYKYGYEYELHGYEYLSFLLKRSKKNGLCCKMKCLSNWDVY